MKVQYEHHMQAMALKIETMTHRLRIFESQLKIEQLSSTELLLLAFMKEQNSGIEGELGVWKTCKEHLSLKALEEIAENEFTEVINRVVETRISEAVLKVADEARYQLKDVKEKMIKENTKLQLIIQDKAEEIVKLKYEKYDEIDRARRDAYEKSAAAYTTSYNRQEAMHLEDRRQIEERIRKEL